MPSTRNQKAKAKQYRDMNMMSDFDNLDIMIGNENINPNERELCTATGGSTVQNDFESNLHSSENFHQGDQFRNPNHENKISRHDGILEPIEAFTNFQKQFNLRLSQEMDSMMSMMHSQINRTISSDTSDRIIPEICNVVSSMSSLGNRDTEASLFQIVRRIEKEQPG